MWCCSTLEMQYADWRAKSIVGYSNVSRYIYRVFVLFVLAKKLYPHTEHKMGEVNSRDIGDICRHTFTSDDEGDAVYIINERHLINQFIYLLPSQEAFV